MSANSVISIDLADSLRLPVDAYEVTPLHVAPPLDRTSQPSLLGGCLLRLPRGVWMLLDLALVCLGTALGNQLFVWWSDEALLENYHLLLDNIVLGSAVILAGCISGLYEPTTLWARSRIVARCLVTVTLTIVAGWVVLHLLMYSNLSRRSIATGCVCFLVFSTGLRLLAHHAVRDIRRGLLVIGQGPLTGTIIRSVRRGAVNGYRLVGVVVPHRHQHSEEGLGDLPIAGDIADVETLVRTGDVHEIVVAKEAANNPGLLKTALECLKMGCRVVDETTFYESALGDVPVSHITPLWFLTADLKGQIREHMVAKRVFDLHVSLIGLVLASPVMLLITMMLRFQGGGPVLYSQRRVGMGGRPFTLYKFRTMRQDAEADGSAWAAPDDPRVTPLGKFLRRSRLDELPQLWNILKGEMSVVGPRPERPEFVAPLATLIPFYNERHLIKPGLTGWAQINHSYGGTIADARRKLQFDLYYVKHTSLELDLIILLRTFGIFFRGAR